MGSWSAGPVEQTWHLAGHAVRRVEQSAAMAGIAEQAAAAARAAEHGDFLILVGAIGHIK